MNELEELGFKRHGWRRICGVYVLVVKGEVVYVGRSVDINMRLSYHQSRIPFDEVYIHECAEDRMKWIESEYIDLLKPTNNIRSDVHHIVQHKPYITKLEQVLLGTTALRRI